MYFESSRIERGTNSIYRTPMFSGRRRVSLKYLFIARVKHFRTQHTKNNACPVKRNVYRRKNAQSRKRHLLLVETDCLVIARTARMNNNSRPFRVYRQDLVAPTSVRPCPLFSDFCISIQEPGRRQHLEPSSSIAPAQIAVWRNKNKKI